MPRQSRLSPAPVRVSPAGTGTRRAELGQAKRARTRVAILEVAFGLMAHENGRIGGIEEFCASAAIARGTFYNYFRSIEELQLTLSQEMGFALFKSVMDITGRVQDPVERLATGIRYYLELPLHDPEWAWALVNTSLAGPIYGAEVNEMLLTQIADAMAQGRLSLSSSQLGHDILAGTGLIAARTILRKEAPEDYPRQAAKAILHAFGVSPAEAAVAVAQPLQSLDSIYDRPFGAKAQVKPRRAPGKREAARAIPRAA